ncbi:hypothetical protein Hanom_Chr03g00228981 [Helianthus anomalus]
MKVGQSNWQKACFVPTKVDANVVAYRKWMKKYVGDQTIWEPNLMDIFLAPQINSWTCYLHKVQPN